MKINNMLAVTFSCLLASSAWAAVDNHSSTQMPADNSGSHAAGAKHAPSAHDADKHPSDESILDHERRDDKTDVGTGTNAVDSHTTGSGTTSESIPSNIPPARAD